MCQNCNCDFFDRCSIVGYINPTMGFCCENCYLYDEHKTCLKSKSRSEEVDKPDTNVMEGLTLRSAAIEGELLKVIISQKEGKEKTIYFDLKQYLIS